MRIWWVRNARVYEGTPLEIVQEMQRMDFANRKKPFGEFVQAVIHHAAHMGFEISAAGETDEALAESLVASMLEAQLAKRC
jgi:hypothetical protein